MQLDTIDDDLNEVFEEEHIETEVEDQNNSKMEEEIYKNRLKVITLESRKVKNEIKKFTPEDVTELHVSNFHERLKDIRDKLDVYCDASAQLIVDLNDDNQEDKARIQQLENYEEILRNEVRDNEKKVGEKIKTLIESQPKTEKEKDDQVKIEKAKINIENVSEKVVELRTLVSKVGKVKELKDEEVREKLIDSKRCTKRFED